MAILIISQAANPVVLQGQFTAGEWLEEAFLLRRIFTRFLDNLIEFCTLTKAFDLCGLSTQHLSAGVRGLFLSAYQGIGLYEMSMKDLLFTALRSFDDIVLYETVERIVENVTTIAQEKSSLEWYFNFHPHFLDVGQPNQFQRMLSVVHSGGDTFKSLQAAQEEKVVKASVPFDRFKRSSSAVSSLFLSVFVVYLE